MNKTRHVELDSLIPLIREQLARGQNVSFSPRGDSMLPMLRSGKDTVTLSPLPASLKKYDLPLYRRDNGQYVLHRIIRTGETYTCIGDHQYIYESGLRYDQMIAVVSGFTRKGKLYSVNDMRYRMYCHFWQGSRGIRWFFSRVKAHLTRIIRL